MKRLLALSLILLAAAGLSAQSLPFDAEIGYRWTDIEGSEDVYRTQINEREGLILRAFRITTNEFAGGVADHFRLDASDLGAGPAGAFRIEAGKAEKWNARVNFRQADAFTFHPGIAGGQHRYDRTRTSFDVDVEFLPGRTIAPFLGYTYGRYDGPGTTTYALGQDEFLLDSDLDETEHEIRGGIVFHTGRFSGLVTQGWRTLEADESLTLFEGAGAGNNPGSVLGRPVNATGITRESNFDVSTPFTNAYVTADVLPKLRLIADFSRFAAEGDGPELETATGSFASFRLSRFYTGFDDSVESSAQTTTLRGGLRAEYSLTDTLDLTAAWRTENRDMNGAAAFHTIFRNTQNFSGADPIAALEEIFEAESALERTENMLEVGVAARQLGPFSLRASYRRTGEDVTLSPDIEEIVIDGPEQRGDYERTIDTIDAVAGFSLAGFNASLGVRRDSADDAILRTDYDSRDRTRFRASYLFRRFLRVGAMTERISHTNDREGIGYENDMIQWGADLELMLRDRFTLRGAYTQYDVDAEALIRRPESFRDEVWSYLEDGESVEAGVGLIFSPISLDADFARYDNEGSNTFDLDRYRVRLVWDFLAHAGIAGEWARDEYDEVLFPSASFKSTRYGVFLRWRQ